MQKIKAKIGYSLAGASGGLAGLAGLSLCGKAGCSSCYGCVTTGGVVLLLLFAGKVFRKKEESNGLA